MTFLLYMRDPGRKGGGPVMNGYLEDLEGETFGTRAEASLAARDHIVFLFHGFNVNRDDGKTSLTGLASHMQLNAGAALVAVLWPGDHWTGALSYPFEGTTADDTAARLDTYIRRVVPRGTRLSFVTHSLGTRVALETIKRLPGDRYSMGRACLMAGAVNNFCFAPEKTYEAAARKCEGMAVLSSREDEVLRFAYPPGNLLHKFMHWERSAGLALGYTGPKNPAVTTLHPTEIDVARNSNHGDYLPPFPKGQAPDKKKHTLNRMAAAKYADDYIAFGSAEYG